MPSPVFVTRMFLPNANSVVIYAYNHDENIPVTEGPQPVWDLWVPCPQLAVVDLISQANLTTLARESK